MVIVSLVFLFVYLFGAYAYGVATIYGLREAGPIWGTSRIPYPEGARRRIDRAGLRLFALSTIWFVALLLIEFRTFVGNTDESWIDLAQFLVYAFPPVIMHTVYVESQCDDGDERVGERGEREGGGEEQRTADQQRSTAELDREPPGDGPQHQSGDRERAERDACGGLVSTDRPDDVERQGEDRHPVGGEVGEVGGREGDERRRDERCTRRPGQAESPPSDRRCDEVRGHGSGYRRAGRARRDIGVRSGRWQTGSAGAGAGRCGAGGMACARSHDRRPARWCQR